MSHIKSTWDMSLGGFLEDDELRPEWRGFMLMMLRGGIAPLARGLLPQTQLTITGQLLDRLSSLGTSAESLLNRQSACSAALVEVIYQIQGFGRLPLDAIEAVLNQTTRRRRKGFTKKDAQECCAQAALLIGGLRLPSMWKDIASLDPNDPVFKFFQWYITINAISFFQWGLPYHFLYSLARDGTGQAASTAFFYVTRIDKTIITLPWVTSRVEAATAKNDTTFFRKLGQALSAASVPKQLRASALDFFLCVFQSWLEQLPLSEQAALIRQGGLHISDKALRNRRSRLGLSTVDLSVGIDLPEEMNRLIHETQVNWAKSNVEP